METVFSIITTLFVDAWYGENQTPCKSLETVESILGISHMIAAHVLPWIKNAEPAVCGKIAQ